MADQILQRSVRSGSGSPEGAVVGNIGDLYTRTSDGTTWVKTTGTGTNTGWTQTGGGSGAPTTAQYVTLATDGSLTNERVLTGTSNQITVTDGGAGANVTLATPQNIHSGASPTFAGLTLTGAITFPDGVRQTFNPDATTAGLNVGSQAGDPASPSDGDVWYNSSANALKARVNGASIALSTGTGDVVGPGSSTDEAVARFDSTTGKLLQNTSTLTLSDAGAFSFPDGVRQTFNPDATNAGLNVGSHAGDPSTPSNGDLWYNSSTPALRARINGATVSLGSGGSTTDAIGITIDGAGSAIATGVKGFIVVPYAATITKVTLLSTDASATAGSIVIDIWKDTYANYPPTVADTITASAKPTLSSANKAEDATLTGWTTSINAGDVLGFNVDSASTVTRVTLVLWVTK